MTTPPPRPTRPPVPRVYDPEKHSNELIRNIALTGGALVVIGIFIAFAGNDDGGTTTLDYDDTYDPAAGFIGGGLISFGIFCLLLTVLTRAITIAIFAANKNGDQ
ncbi:hypothetical protein ACE1OC_28460 [Streptomyces sp. DSM 116496]|uniref:hypothetical protein n=1 Tax=Streptomyces stoeckheimensis TaxID=3344656 RepID=UPI0038B32ACF